MRNRKKKVKIETGPTGGVFFYFSLISLVFLAIINSIALPSLVLPSALQGLAFFSVCAAGGAFFAHLFIRGHISVFIHEFKHSLISHFAGNKGKEMRVRKDSGHFTYQFTKETARFNAMIALAPYWIPVFTVPAVGAAYLVLGHDALYMVMFVGVAYGADLLLNMRDISPHQTDLTNIRGGYSVALTYIAAMNVTLATILLAWVLQGPPGLFKLAAGVVRTLALVIGR